MRPTIERCVFFCVMAAVLATAAPALGQKAKKKKASLAELAELEWKLEQGAGALASNPNAAARRKAIADLASLTDPRVAQPLAYALKEDPDPAVRLTAAQALAALKTPEAKGLLTLAGGADPDEKVREAAKAALAKFPKKMAPAALPLKGRSFTPPKGSVTGGVISQTLALPSGDARLWAVRELEKQALPSRTELLGRHLLKDPSARVRSECARVLGKTGGKGALPTLIKALSDGDPTVRFGVAQQLATFDDGGAVTVLQKLAADDTDSSVRAEVRDLLEPSTAAGQRLLRSRIQKIASPNPVDRINALSELAKFTDWRAMVPMACTLVADKSPHVRTAAAKAVENLHDTAVLAALRAAAVVEPDEKQKAAVRALLQSLRRKVDGLVSQLQSADVNERVKAARALGAGAYPPGLDPLVAALKDKEPRVRRAVVSALRSFDDAKAQNALKAIGSDSDAQVRKTVDEHFKQLEKLKGWRTFYKDPNRLVMKTTDSDPVWRADAAIALGVGGAERTVTNLTILLASDKIEEVRLAAAWALVLMASEGGEAALKRAAAKDPSERVRAAARKYLVIDKVSQDDLAQQLLGGNAQTRLDAADALSLRASGKVLPVLLRAGMCDPDAKVRAAALRGLARIGDPMARTVIKLASVRDPDERVRRTALVMFFLAGGK
ncbi:MAG: HEAT repeat domain-containing protein [Deltaproteobacteria bacterium]|nr:HEAT repeat domain-containing protein [Deltaproteobacteria bacterium]